MMHYKFITITILLLIISTSTTQFTCSFTQEENEFTCFGKSVLCELELVLLKKPKLLEARKDILETKDAQLKLACIAYRKYYRGDKNIFLSCDDLPPNDFFTQIKDAIDNKPQSKMFIYFSSSYYK